MRSVRNLLIITCLGCLIVILPNNMYHSAKAQILDETNDTCFPRASIYDLAFSPDGSYLAAVSSEYTTVPLWNVQTGQKEKEFSLSRKTPYGLFYIAFSPDGKYIAATTETVAVLWDVRSGKQTHILESKQEEPSGLRIAFTPDSKYLLISGQFGGSLWDITTQKEVQTYPVPLSDIEITVDLSPDGKYVLVNGDKDATLLDTQTGKVVHRFDFDRWTESSFSPDGQYIFIKTYAIHKDGFIGTLWDAKTFKQVHVFDADKWWQISANSKYLLIESDLPVIYQLWDIQSGEKLQKFDYTSKEDNNYFSAFLPDGEHLILADYVSKNHYFGYTVWNIPTNKEAHKFALENEDLHFVRFSPDGTLMVGATGGGQMYMWDTQLFKQIRRFC